VCRQLGFSKASNYTRASRFGNVSIYFSYEKVNCTGKEETLAYCSNNLNLTNFNCGAGDGAGVVCQK